MRAPTIKTASACLVILMLGVLLPSAAIAQPRHQRDSWYIGLGLGTGLAAQWQVDGRTLSFDDWLAGTDKDPKIAINFKVGGTLSPRSLLGIDLTAVSQSGSAGSLDATAQINNYFLMLTHFPNYEGFFVRAGGGVSKILIVVDTPSGDFTNDVNGLGTLFGFGYAFWLGKTFNLTLNVDQSFQWYSNIAGEPDRSQFTILYLGFDWY